MSAARIRISNLISLSFALVSCAFFFSTCMPSALSAESSDTWGVRSSIFDFVSDPWKSPKKEDESARFFQDGLIVIKNGVIEDCGKFESLSKKYQGLNITRLDNRIIVPGFVDGHVHCPQTRVLGAFGHQLLPWLQTWIYPEELKYRNPEYAQKGTTAFFEDMLASGTTTFQAFTTSSPVSTEALFEEASKRNMRVIAGLTGIDRNAPADFLIKADDFYTSSKDLIQKYHGKGRNLYAITPRFAYGSSPELLKACQKLKTEFPDLWVNTHISENPSEIHGVLAEYPDCHDYLGVYEKYALVGPKFSGGHGVWLSDDEFKRISQKGATVVFCPTSNLFLGSGLFRLGKALSPEAPVRLSMGSDMGGGNSFSMLEVLNEAYKVGMVNNTMLDGSVDPKQQNLDEAERNKLSPYRAFYALTLGGARGLYVDDKIGNFDKGKEADFVVLDWNAGPRALKWHQSLIVGDKGLASKDIAANVLFGIMSCGDDRNVDETWVMGKRAYKRDRGSSSTEQSK